MTENPVPLYSIQYRRLFPWLHLARAFWIAMDPRKIVLAGVALLLVSAGSLAFDEWLPFGKSGSIEGSRVRESWPWQASLGYRWRSGSDEHAGWRGAFRDPLGTIVEISTNWQVVLRPFREFVEPAGTLFRADASTSQVADAVTRSLWNLLVWSLFGGAITRIAALQFARDQQIGIRRAIAFSATKYFGYLTAPLMPLVGIAVFWILCIVGGWIGRIPAAGEIVLGALWGLELLFGGLMAIVLVGVAAGWPLMFATISVEGSDGFDGLSRAYNYVFERPLYFLWQAIVTMLFGSITIFFVWVLSQLLTQLAVWGVSWGQGYEATAGLIAGAPDLVLPGEPVMTAHESLGKQLAHGWMCVLGVLVTGFVHSFFWSSATIAYFLLRNSVDGNDLDEVYAEETEERDDLLPLVGTAAMGEAGKPPASPTGSPAAAPSSPPVDLTP